MSELPEWPKAPDNYPQLYEAKLPMTSLSMLSTYERARADAAMARLRVAVEALNCLYPGLALDLRYSNDPEEIDVFRSRVNTIEDAIRAIGELPHE